jgi:hypothetical protein
VTALLLVMATDPLAGRQPGSHLRTVDATWPASAAGGDEETKGD